MIHNTSILSLSVFPRLTGAKIKENAKESRKKCKRDTNIVEKDTNIE